MIMYDMNKGDYRTFVYDRITQLELNGVTYKIN
jgi:predicted DNA-binding transcriptional regulator YafY